MSGYLITVKGRPYPIAVVVKFSGKAVVFADALKMPG